MIHSTFYPALQSAKSGQLGEEFQCNFLQSDFGGCYRDVATMHLLQETDEVRKALNLSPEPEPESSPFISQLSASFDEDSRISFQSDPGYVSETPPNHQLARDYCDSVFSPSVTAFPVPPSRSVSSVASELSTSYSTYPSPVPRYSPIPAGDDAPHYDCYPCSDKAPQLPCNPLNGYPSSHYSPPWASPRSIADSIPRCSTSSTGQPNTDPKYKVRREKNNIASQISRQKKKKKVQDLEDRAQELESQNDSLRCKAANLEAEIAQVREQLFVHMNQKASV